MNGAENAAMTKTYLAMLQLLVLYKKKKKKKNFYTTVLDFKSVLKNKAPKSTDFLTGGLEEADQHHDTHEFPTRHNWILGGGGGGIYKNISFMPK
jgi:hypothetical protein